MNVPHNSLLCCAQIHALPYVHIRGYDFCPFRNLESQKTLPIDVTLVRYLGEHLSMPCLLSLYVHTESPD